MTTTTLNRLSILILELEKKFPNDYDLGKRVRELIHVFKDGQMRDNGTNIEIVKESVK